MATITQAPVEGKLADVSSTASQTPASAGAAPAHIATDRGPAALPPATQRTIHTAQLITTMLKAHKQVSDLIFSPGRAPQIESNGQLVELRFKGLEKLTPYDTNYIANDLMAGTDHCKQKLEKDGSTDLSYGIEGIGRFRVNIFRQRGSIAIVMRVIPDKIPGFDELKLPKVLEELVHLRNGIVLVTGPTGSGKTTTLYASLERINDNTRNIMTVEDPIEYYIDGIGQTQVNTKVEMTFARGLRAILRQDPDVVMVGEIRDLETAQIAVQASLTGHLVLSTLHTNTAVGAVTRLRDMGIEPFLLSSSLIGVMAQRLVRVLNPSNREKFMAGEYERRLLNLDPNGPPVELYRPSSDPGNGYRGRTGIYELIAVDDHMRTMIHDGSSEQELERYARSASPGIRDDGRRKVMIGETTLEEVLRVTRED